MEAVGLVKIAYVPVFNVSFPKIIGSEIVIFVFSLAPVLQISLNGTTSPKTVRLLFDGREYSILISVKPTRCSTVAIGLNFGACICALTEIPKFIKNNTDNIFFITIQFFELLN